VLVEGVGYNIDWDGSTSTVIITTGSDSGSAAQQPINDGRIVTTARQVSQTIPTINIHGMELTREQFQGLVGGRYYVCVENPGRHELARAQGSDPSVRPYIRYSGYSERDFTYGAAFDMLSRRNQQFSGAGSRRNGVITLFYFIDAERRWETGNPPAWVNGVLGNIGQTPPNQQSSTPIDGFVDINGIEPVVKTIRELDLYVKANASSIILPNRGLTEVERQEWIDEYNALGGMNAFELEIVRLVNELREEHGLNQLAICPKLSLAARFHTQVLINTNWDSWGAGAVHRAGPYGGSSQTAIMFGGSPIMGVAARGGVNPSISGWVNSPGHLQSLLHPQANTVGAGIFVDEGAGFRYLIVGF